MGNTSQQSSQKMDVKVENYFPTQWVCSDPKCNNKSSWWGLINSMCTIVIELCEEHGEYISKYLSELKDREDWYVAKSKLTEQDARKAFRKEEIQANDLHRINQAAPMKMRCTDEWCSEFPTSFGVGVSYKHAAICVIEACDKHSYNSILGPLQETLNKLWEKSKEDKSPEEVVEELGLTLSNIKEIVEHWYDLSLAPQHLEGLDQLAYALGSTCCYWCKTATLKTDEKFCNDICEAHMTAQEDEAKVLAREAAAKNAKWTEPFDECIDLPIKEN